MNHRLVAVAVAEVGTAEIARWQVEGFEEIGIAIKNNTAVALDAFEVHAKFHPGGAEVPLATLAADYSAPLWPLRRADAVVTLAGNTTGRLFMNVQGIHTLILKASAGAGGTTVDVEAQTT